MLHKPASVFIPPKSRGRLWALALGVEGTDRCPRPAVPHAWGWFTFSTETPAMSGLRVQGLGFRVTFRVQGLRLGFRNTLVSNSGNRSLGVSVSF